MGIIRRKNFCGYGVTAKREGDHKAVDIAQKEADSSLGIY